MTKVQVLQYGDKLQGLFETPEAAHKRIVEDAPRGTLISNVTIKEFSVIGSEPSRRAEDYPRVLAHLIEGKKIQAIKEMRENVPGMLLKEAKDAVEAVFLLDLPQSMRDAAQALVTPAPLPERYQFTHDTWFYDEIVDNNSDTWYHVGGGFYVEGVDPHLLPLKGTTEELTADGIDSRYGIRNQRDL